MTICKYCNANEIPEHSNWTCCDELKCVIAMHEEAGYTKQCPNGLEPRCFTADGLMLECEDADNPDYIFPVEVEYVGEREEGGCEFDYMNEQHALVYANHCIAVTCYETCYSTWMLSPFRGEKGLCLGGHLHKANEYKLTEKSLAEIKEYTKKKARFSNLLKRVMACNPIQHVQCDPISEELLEKIWSNDL